MKKFTALLITLFVLVLIGYIANLNQGQSNKEEKTLNVYFIKVRSGNNSKYVAVKRPYKGEAKKFKIAIKELLKGPTKAEKEVGLYSAIPVKTKLLSVEETSVNADINLSAHFEYGGGTTSMIHRINQLVKTAVEATPKPVYLKIEGEEVEAIGGEGIILEQPLDKNLKKLKK